MESAQPPNPPCGVVEITEADLVRFLIFFAGLWLKTNQYLKAGRALLAAAILRLLALWRREDQIQPQKEGWRRSIQDPLDLAAAARVVFAGMTNLDVHPFVLQVLKEMEKEANRLLSSYLLAVYQQEEPCG